MLASPQKHVPTSPKNVLPGRRPSYVRVTAGKLSEPSGSSNESLRSDGRALAQQCLSEIDTIPNGKRLFPPRLFTLWVTPAFAGSDSFVSFLAGINEELADDGIDPMDAPLIGTTVSAVWFDAKVRENGAVLICQASKWIKAKVAVAENANIQPEQSAEQLLNMLEGGGVMGINPRNNRYLMTYVAGFSTGAATDSLTAPELVEAISRLTFGRLHLFGGVSAAGTSADNFQPRLGSQFVNNRVYQHAAVAALVSSDIAYGMGINPGIVSTGEGVIVKDVSEDGLTIREFDQGPASKVYEKWNHIHPFVFATRGRDGQLIVNAPKLLDGTIRMSRPVVKSAMLEIACPSSDVLQRSVRDLEKWALRSFNIRKMEVTAVLAIGCISRFRERHRVGFDVNQALDNAAKRYPNSIHIGCYLDGEIGIDSLGRSIITNWSVSEILIADAVPSRSELFLGFDALAEFLTDAASASSVPEAIQKALQIIEHAGFPGGMISLIYRDKPSDWIHAVDGFGRKWKEVIVPRTSRVLEGEDILAIAAREPDPVFVGDAQKDPRCSRQAAIDGDVRSFVAIRLMDATHRYVLGVLQVDVGDKRNRKPHAANPETLTLVKTLGLIIELLLSRALHAEELAVTRRLDELEKECLKMKSLEGAVQHFFVGATQQLGSSGHVRLMTPDKSALQLVAGSGPYFKQASRFRQVVPLTDSSVTVDVFKAGDDWVSNNPSEDGRAKLFRQQVWINATLGQVLHDNKSFADYVIRRSGETDEKIGVVSFASLEPWFFTPSRVKSIEHIRQRLAQVITHIRDRNRQLTAQQSLLCIDTYLANRLHGLTRRAKTLAALLELLSGREQANLSNDGKQRLTNAIFSTQPLFEAFDEAKRLGSLLSNPSPPTSFSIYSLVERIVHESQERQLGMNSSVNIEVTAASSAAENIKVEASVDQIAECLRNLLGNAIRAANPFGWVRVNLNDNAQRNCCEILVQDSGEPGLSLQTFDAFVDGHRKSTDGGLGLYLSRLFCEANGGTLDLAKADSQPVLRISLPWRKFDLCPNPDC